MQNDFGSCGPRMRQLTVLDGNLDVLDSVSRTRIRLNSTGMRTFTATPTESLLINTDGKIYQEIHNFEKLRAHRLQNKSGVATVQGEMHEVATGGVDFCVGQKSQLGASYLVAGSKEFIVVLGGGVAADGYDDFVPMSIGNAVRVLSTGACTRGQWVIFSAGTVGRVDPSAVPVPGITIGICLETTGGAGLVTVMCVRKYA